MITTIPVKTNSNTELIDISSHVIKFVQQSGILDGLCTIFIPHTTAGITINENADPSVAEDILKEINKIIPFDDSYLHMEGNSAAHIKSSLFGTSQTIIIEKGQLLLGTWQGIYFCEFDGPRDRKVVMKVIED
ncbi:secondary thiamine-phosphate synthase enzyme YjbQ [Chlamydiota bacterium]